MAQVATVSPAGALRVPAPPLRRFIDHYVGYRVDAAPSGVHRGLPSRHMTLIVSIGPTVDVLQQTDSQQAPDSYRCVLSGLQASAALIAQDGCQEGVAIALTPLGSRALLGMSARELWDLTVELADVVGPAGDELWERLQPPTLGWADRFDICDAVLTRLLRPLPLPAELRHSWSALVRTGGRIPIGQLAADVGFTRQHLGRLFRAEFGLGPKLAARVIRFEQARRLLPGVHGSLALAEVAAATGYYDQAHLCRDFRDLAGCDPSTYLRDEVPFVQDREGAPSA